MKKLAIITVLGLLFLLSGCVEDEVEPNVIWSGILLDAGMTERGTWIEFDGEYGVMTKIWLDHYPVIESLTINKSYSFYSYIKLTEDSRIVVPFRLIRIEDEFGEIIWKE